MNDKKTRRLPLWQGILCLLLSCFCFLWTVSLSSTSVQTLWLYRASSIGPSFWFPPAIFAALALGILLLLGAGSSGFPAPAMWVQRIFGLLCLCGALVLLLQRVHYRALFQMAVSPWQGFPGGRDLLVATLPQFLWMLLALTGLCWMLMIRSRLDKAGRVFCWTVVIACALYCLLSFFSVILPSLTASTPMERLNGGLRGTFRMCAMIPAWLVPLAFVLLLGVSAEKSPDAFDASRGFVLWSILVAVANALMLLSLGSSIEYFSFLSILVAIGIQLSYGLLLRGRRIGFWLLLIITAVSTAVNFFITGPLALVGLVNPLICCLLLRNSWSSLR